jgi:hypothetical protein
MTLHAYTKLVQSLICCDNSLRPPYHKARTAPITIVSSTKNFATVHLSAVFKTERFLYQAITALPLLVEDQNARRVQFNHCTNYSLQYTCPPVARRDWLITKLGCTVLSTTSRIYAHHQISIASANVLILAARTLQLPSNHDARWYMS